MGNSLKAIKLNGKELKLSEITIESTKRCVDKEYEVSTKTSGEITNVSLYGVDFTFRNNKLISFSIIQSIGDYLGKVLLIDNNDNETDIHSMYDLIAMTYFDITSKTVKGNNVSAFISIYSYDNVSCKISRDNKSIMIVYDIAQNSVIDIMFNKLQQLKRNSAVKRRTVQ